MATSAPPPEVQVVSGWGQSIKDIDNPSSSNSLDFGVAGSYNSDSSHLQRYYMTMDSGDSVQSQSSASRGPPGLSAPPAGGGHIKNSSATTAQLTLTPASSVDGSTADNHYNNNNNNNHNFGPSMPTLPHGNDYHSHGASSLDDHNAELPHGITTFGSFGNETDDDGLLGLHALRERSYSSPGPNFSSSPVTAKGSIGTGSYQDDSGARAMANQRPRAVSKDNGRGANRPPLSGTAGSSSAQVDSLSSSFQGAMNFNNTSRNNYSEYPYDQQPQSLDKGGLGTIGRYGNNLDPSQQRRSSTGTDPSRDLVDNNSYSHYHERNHSLDHTTPAISNKFGSLPSLSSQLNSQRGGNYDAGNGLQRHQRSMSQPGPFHGGGMYDQYGHSMSSEEFMYQQPDLVRRSSDYSASGRYPSGSDQDYNEGRYSKGRPTSGDHPLATHGRSMSLTHTPMSSSNNMGGQRRHSASQNHPGLQRRDAPEFIPGQGHYDGPRSSSISPSQSPMQVSYGRGSGGDLASSSPMSMGSGVMRGQQGYGHDPYRAGGRHGSNFSDDDLSHPLIGEHIEVPGDDQGYMGQGHGRVHPRSASFDQHYPGEIASYLPTAGAGMSAPKNVYNVKFKRTQRSFVMGPRLNRDLKIGTYVKVEADRGEDLGIIIGRVAPDKIATAGRGGYRGSMGDMVNIPPTAGAGPPPSDLKRIIRLATHDEVSLLAMKREEEEELLQVCRTKVRQRALPMRVVDAEYQFDRHKLTFFFEAEGRIDFRELVRDLFSMYKTRIWMQQLDKNTSIPVPIEGPAPPVQMDYGTPIIAPASEFEEFAAMNDQVGEINID